jgi:hypothetical protein
MILIAEILNSVLSNFKYTVVIVANFDIVLNSDPFSATKFMVD